MGLWTGLNRHRKRQMAGGCADFIRTIGLGKVWGEFLD